MCSGKVKIGSIYHKNLFYYQWEYECHNSIFYFLYFIISWYFYKNKNRITSGNKQNGNEYTEEEKI
jgi:hypothetical protein